MPKEFSRSQRVSAQIQRELADLVREEMKDPRVGNVTFCGVDVSRDLAFAKVYVTVLGKAREEANEALEVLDHAASFLRRQLGARMRLRTVPVLQFRYDDSMDRGARLSALIDQALAKDRSDKKAE